jgi:rSAM/selenodomain-associated transferase 1
MTNDRLLMVFVRNPVLGKVKTRLAQTMGNERALEIYLLLLEHTLQIASKADCDKAVYYSDYIESEEDWVAKHFKQCTQTGKDLGERMANAFQTAFASGYKKVVIIGSDCLELHARDINEAFEKLQYTDAVVGPAKDGGYYLLGLNAFHPAFFQNKKWSTENVFLDTLIDLQNLKLSFDVLPTLSDIDEEKDLEFHKSVFNQ